MLLCFSRFRAATVRDRLVPASSQPAVGGQLYCDEPVRVKKSCPLRPQRLLCTKNCAFGGGVVES